jgi:hypothetical protein
MKEGFGTFGAFDILSGSYCVKEYFNDKGIWCGFLRMDGTRDVAACIYHRPDGSAEVVGGDGARGYLVFPQSVVMRLGRDALEAARMAGGFYGDLKGLELENGFMKMSDGAPVGLGQDDKGVFEFQIDYDIYVNRRVKENDV